MSRITGHVRSSTHFSGYRVNQDLASFTTTQESPSVEPFHIYRHVDEQVFRFDNRATKENRVSDLARFFRLLSHIVNRRITYEKLTGKGTDAVH